MADDDDLSMDPTTMERQARRATALRTLTPWEERRMATIGCSELPALFVCLGLADDELEPPPDYVVKDAKRLVAVKARAANPSAAGPAAARGKDVEHELVELVNSDPTWRWPRFTHASSIPEEWLPFVDRHCPKLSCTPDAWMRQFGALWNVQVKTDIRGAKTAVPWWWNLQVQGEMAVQSAGGTLVLYGPGWASWNDNDRRKPQVFVVERDDALIQRIRAAVELGWAQVEAMKARIKEQEGPA